MGEHSDEQVKEHFKNLRDKFEQGFEFVDGVILRRISKADLDRINHYQSFSFFRDMFSRIDQRTFAIEFLPSEEQRVDSIVNDILLALRLYQEGDVFCKVVWSKPGKNSSLLILDPPIPEFFRAVHYYVLEMEEVKDVCKIFNQIEVSNLKNASSLRIACERFSRSYERYLFDEQIIDFMIAFEALFLKGDKAPSNTGQMIGLACAMLLGKNETEREKIRRFFMRAYRMRNRIVHGSETSSQERKDLPDFVLELKEYLRESIKKMM